MSAPPRERTETNSGNAHPWWDEPRSPRPAGLLYALRRYWLVALLPMILFGALGVAYGNQRQPTYTASSRLIVGGLQLNTSGAQAGFATAVQGLAEAYSRAVTADNVIGPVARQFRTTPDAIRGSLNGTPLPNSPIFTITAVYPNERGAVQLANATSQALLRYLQKLYGNNPATQRLLRAYRRASETTNEKNALAAERKKRYDANQTRSNRDAYVRAKSEADSASLDQQAIGEQYTAASGSNVGSSTIVQVLSGASAATSDHKAAMEKFGLIGVVIGLIIGLAAALALANRRVRRTATA
jgi:capsular polysaccharide biosynthesis protein